MFLKGFEFILQFCEFSMSDKYELNKMHKEQIKIKATS